MKAIIIHTIAFLSSFTFSLAEDKTVNDSSPWKQVAEKAILSMNKGNGDLFTSLAHSELKAEMRKKIIELLLEVEGENELSKQLSAYGVKSISELEQVDIDLFISKTISKMHNGVSEEMRKAQESVVVESSSSMLNNDNLHEVILKCKISHNKEETKFPILIYVKNEKGTWKYYGDNKSKPK